MTRILAIVRCKLLPLFVAISCTIGCFYWFRGGFLEHPLIGGSGITEYVFLAGVPRSELPDGWAKREAQLQELFTQWNIIHPGSRLPFYWASRVLSVNMAAWWVEWLNPVQMLDMMNVYAGFNIIFIGATFLLIALFCKLPVAILAIPATMAALVFNSAPSFTPYFQPWDMIDLFAFTAAFLCYRFRQWWLLIAVVFLGGLVKESVLPAALFLYAMPWQRHRRWVEFVLRSVLVAGLVILPQWLNLCLFVPPGVHESWTIAIFSADPMKIPFHLKALENLAPSFLFRWNNVLFAGCGSLAALLWIVFRKGCRGEELALVAVVVAYFVGEWAAGIANEYRIWSEVLPMSWILIGEHLTQKGTI